MLMVTPLDYYLHNSTFITPPRGAGQMCKTKGKSLPDGRLSVIERDYYWYGTDDTFR